MKILSDDKIAEVAVVCWPALEEHERKSFRLVVKEQARVSIEEFSEELNKLGAKGHIVFVHVDEFQDGVCISECKLKELKKRLLKEIK